MDLNIFQKDYAEVRVVTSPGGTSHWVTLRSSNAVNASSITIFCKSEAQAQALAAALRSE